MVRMFATASYVYNTASGLVYGPPPPPTHSQTLRPNKKRRNQTTNPSSKRTSPNQSRPSSPVAGPSRPHSNGGSSGTGNGGTGPEGGRHGHGKKRRTGEVGVGFDLVDEINRERDLYKILGVGRGAKVDEIRKGYIGRSRICHPDKLPQYPPCTAAFQKLSFAYETLSKPSSRRLYDLSGPSKDFFTDGRASSAGFGDETLNGVLYATFCEFMEGDFEMIRVLVNALNEGNPGLNLSENMIENLEAALRRLRLLLLSGQKYVRVIRFELIRLYEIQHSLRQLSYFNITGRLRLSLALARVTLSIPMAVDKAMKEEREAEGEEGEGGEGGGGLLPKGVAGLLGATVKVLERGERVTLWGTAEHLVDEREQGKSTSPAGGGGEEEEGEEKKE